MNDKYIQSWETPEGFLKLFYQLCSQYVTNEKAYEAAERMFQAQFGRRRYSCYGSFKNTKNEKVRNRKKSQNPKILSFSG